jgi:hypothetical protein
MKLKQLKVTVRVHVKVIVRIYVKKLREPNIH